MSFDVNWDVESQREDHECEEHWQLRKTFIERWKHEYPKDRLICLARVFSNIEFLGCRYPAEVMREVARLSQEVATDYRKAKRGKLQRTFVSASDAAEDRARGVKREGGVVKEGSAPKSSRIQFVKQGQGPASEAEGQPDNHEAESTIRDVSTSTRSEDARRPLGDLNEYLRELGGVRCLEPRAFHEGMFCGRFGRLVLLVRPWAGRWWNIQTSCQVCNIPFTSTFEDGAMCMAIGGQLVARAAGLTKAEAKSNAETVAWNRLREEVITVVVKEQFRADSGGSISVREVTRRREEEFGAPLEDSVATKMMRLMGWAGGGLGADAQGIAEPIKPHLQMVNRQGLGSACSDAQGLRRAAAALMRRFLASDCLDVDLIFSRDFSKEERASLHQVAQKVGLASRSYGAGDERFLVVKKKLDPFSLARAVLEKGGNTAKYQVFIPCGVSGRNGRGRR